MFETKGIGSDTKKISYVFEIKKIRHLLRLTERFDTLKNHIVGKNWI
jgi:hypothetical protein